MRIGRYEVTGEIGRGGMGVVLRGRSPDGREVALKVLRHERRDAHARFQREGRLLAALGEAQGFVPCLETGDSPAGPFIVMPYLDGGTLRDRMARGPLELEAALELVAALATAVGRAHERGIVHRDLKPENVLFKAGKPLVTDLGLARHYDRAVLDGSQSYGLSRSGEVRGTAGYMAPEQLDDARQARPQADVFALGAILYECLTGAPALGTGSVLEQFGVVESGRIVPPSSLRQDLPRWLERELLRALSFDAARRHPDGHAFARALRLRGRSDRRRMLGVGGALLLVAASVAVALSLRARRVSSVDRAEQLLAVRDFQGALLEAQRALDEDPLLARAYSARGAARVRTRSFASGKADLDRAIELDPNLAIAWVRRGEHALHVDGEEKRGIADFTRALELDPKNVEACYGRGKIRAATGDLAGGRADLDRAVELAPDLAPAIGLRGAIRGVSGDVDGSIVDLDRAIALSPNTAEYLSNRSGAWFNKHDLDRSIADANRAIALDPRDVNALSTRAACWMQRGEHLDEALADLNKALAIKPKSVTGLINRAAHSIRTKTEIPRAIEDLRRAAAIEPRNRTIWTNLAVAYQIADDDKGVLDAMDHFLEIAPDDTEMHLNRSTVRLKLKDFAGAIADASIRIASNPEEAYAWRVRGIARMDSGENAGAATDLERFLALAPSDEWAESVRKRLARLEAAR